MIVHLSDSLSAEISSNIGLNLDLAAFTAASISLNVAAKDAHSQHENVSDSVIAKQRAALAANNQRNISRRASIGII